ENRQRMLYENVLNEWVTKFGLCFKFVLIGYNFYILMFFVGASTVVYYLLDSSSLLIYDSVTLQGEYTSRLLPLQFSRTYQFNAYLATTKTQANALIYNNLRDPIIK
ncbi:hypothetical protein ACJX0J_041741, partial [Zea mays]